MNRRKFLFFFLAGGLMGLIRRKTGVPAQPRKKAMYWRKKDDV